MYNAIRIRYRKGEHRYTFRSRVWKNGDSNQRLIAEREVDADKIHMLRIGAHVVSLNVIRIPSPDFTLVSSPSFKQQF